MKKSEVIILKSALLLIDLQKDFCKNGALEVKEGDEVIKTANKMIEKFNKKGSLIIATKDWHPDEHKSFAVNSNAKIGEIGELNGLMQVWWPKHCVENTSGSEFHDELNLYYTQYKILHDFSEVDDEIIKISLCDCFNRDSINNIYNIK